MAVTDPDATTDRGSASASSVAFHEIRHRIESGALQPGDRLPQERVFAAELGISRNAFREAVSALTLLGVVEPRQGSGTYVTSLTPRELMGALTHTSSLVTTDVVLDVIEARKYIESSASALAAERASDAQLEQIRRLHDEMSTITDTQRYRDLDRQFHQAIVESCGNTTLMALAGVLSSGVPWYAMWQTVTSDEIPEFARIHHAQIVEALETHDAALAQAIAYAHVAAAERRAKAALAEQS